MYAPIGFTPLAMLWDQFVESRIDTIYHSATAHYAAEEFNAVFVRGSPLDIAEHVFCGLMWRCGLHAASSDGTVIRIHSKFQDGLPGLFSTIGPYRSNYEAAAADEDAECGREVENLASIFFEGWSFEPDDGHQWKSAYPVMSDTNGQLPERTLESLRFHTLPICFERQRFTLVDSPPKWSSDNLLGRDQEILIGSIGGRALCIPNSALVGWEKILNGQTPILDIEVSLASDKERQIGRPAKLPRVIKAYKSIYPDGHTCSWKEATAEVSKFIGETISQQTLRRAIKCIGTEADQNC